MHSIYLFFDFYGSKLTAPVGFKWLLSAMNICLLKLQIRYVFGSNYNCLHVLFFISDCVNLKLIFYFLSLSFPSYFLYRLSFGSNKVTMGLI